MKPTPLSKTLDELLDGLPEGEAVSVNWMISKTGGRGIYLVFIWLGLPFVVPVSLPGTSVVAGLIMMVMCWSLMSGRAGQLPAFIGDRSLPINRESKIYRGSMAFLKWMEKWIKPRKSDWIEWPAVSKFNILLLGFLAFLLVCPVPGVIPFTNALPSYAIIAVAAGVMEKDGLCLFYGYILAIATSVYFGFVAGGIIALFVRYSKDILLWVQQLI
jgi:hypothetical protein